MPFDKDNPQNYMVYSDQKSRRSLAKVALDDNQTKAKTSSNCDKIILKLQPHVTVLKQAFLEYFWLLFVPL